MTVIDEALDIENWNRECSYGIHMCSKLCVCVCVYVFVLVLHNISNFKLCDCGNFLYFVGEILRNLDLYDLLVKYYG
jgi:hypothetical protein